MSLYLNKTISAGNVGSSAAGSDDGKDIPNEIERAGSAADGTQFNLKIIQKLTTLTNYFRFSHKAGEPENSPNQSQGGGGKKEKGGRSVS